MSISKMILRGGGFGMRSTIGILGSGVLDRFRIFFSRIDDDGRLEIVVCFFVSLSGVG